MTRYQSHTFEIPQETITIAQAAYPHGNVYMLLRDKLGPLFDDVEFAELFSWQGQSGMSPGLLAMVTVMQYMEGLTDRQTADAVRGRIDWKYALGLAMTDSGFDYSILSGFRGRLLDGGKEAVLFNNILDKLHAHNLLSGKKQQRTDSTHVLAAVRNLNRLACVGETLRRVLDDLARVAPKWLLKQVTPDWFDRYSARFEIYRLPEQKAKQETLQLQIGQDGAALLDTIYSSDAPNWLRELPSVEIMCRIWLQQYYVEDGTLKWREQNNLPPFKKLIISPDDIEARNRTKRDTNWSGYAVHLTETHAENAPHIITHVETTPATTADAEMTGIIHRALADKSLLPDEHLVDTAYVSIDHLLESQREYQINLFGPMGGGGSWQAKAGKGFDVSRFTVDWEKRTLTCPEGQVSQNWHQRHEKYGHAYWEIRFEPAACRICPHLSECTRSKRGVRTVCIRPQVEYETLKTVRERQTTQSFKDKYKKRAGIEGTISQGVRTFGLRRSRYIGLAKTRLQHLVTAAAMNLTRVVAWWRNGEAGLPPYGSPFAKLALIA